MQELHAELQTYLQENGPHLAGRAFIAAAVLVATVVLARVARSAVHAGIRGRVTERRAATVEPIAQSFARGSIWSVGLVTALHQVGLNVTTVLAGAGVVGIAVGFGAQTLVRDIISGFFVIMDDIVETGDHITFNSVTGIAEEVGLRLTKIRSFDGRLWYVPNGELKIVGNFNRDWARAAVVVPLPHEQDVESAMAVLDEVAQQWAHEHPESVLEPPEAQAVLSLDASNVNLRLVVKVPAMQHWAIERELMRRLKAAFDARGFEPPVPRQVVYHRGSPP